MPSAASKKAEKDKKKAMSKSGVRTTWARSRSGQLAAAGRAVWRQERGTAAAAAAPQPRGAFPRPCIGRWRGKQCHPNVHARTHILLGGSHLLHARAPRQPCMAPKRGQQQPPCGCPASLWAALNRSRTERDGLLHAPSTARFARSAFPEAGLRRARTHGTAHVA